MFFFFNMLQLKLFKLYQQTCHQINRSNHIHPGGLALQSHVISVVVNQILFSS